MVIYVDVLFVVNFFITYLLLISTSFFAKSEIKQYRAVIASVLGGLYSLVIIFDKLNFLLSAIGKIFASLLIVFVAFGFIRVWTYLKNFIIFYFSNVLFLGVISAICMFFSPKGMTVKNSNVYFDISATQLLVSAFCAYLVTYIIIKITNRTLAKGEIYSFLGWIIETIYAIFIHGHFVKRGFLFGPVCPIYGFGALLLIVSTRKIYKKAWLKFLISAIAFTIFEYMVSLILEVLFGLRWWDYSNDFLNIQGRVSLPYSLFWGIIGLVLLDRIHPTIQNQIQNIAKSKINKINQLSMVITLTVILISDTILSTIKYLNI